MDFSSGGVEEVYSLQVNQPMTDLAQSGGQWQKKLSNLLPGCRPQGKVMFLHTSVIPFTIGLMDTLSLLTLVGYSVAPCLE